MNFWKIGDTCINTIILVGFVMTASCYIFGKIPLIQYVAVQYKGWAVARF